MTEEQKQLLMKDLCGRLPYGVNVLHVKDGVIGVLHTVNVHVEYDPQRKQKLKCVTSFFGKDNVPIEEFKPYLYPLSSMTEERRKEFVNYSDYEERDEDCGRHKETYYYDCVGHEDKLYPNVDSIDWLNAYHFDYRGLIEQGLAIDATGIITYNKEE